MRALIPLCLLLALAGQAVAEAPMTSPRPERRPGAGPAPVAVSAPRATESALRRSPRPQRRPGSQAITQTMPTAAAPAQPARDRGQPRRGSVCGVRAIRGQAIKTIPGRLPGCGVSDPVRITEVAGVRLSQASVMDCTTAKALNTWVEHGAKPAVGRLGGGLVGLRVVAHYACRTRNNQPGARISEHGKGHAIDIAGFVLRNGVTLTVLNGWRDPVQGKVLKAIHRAACGPFGTVLGPKSDRFHQDHFHLDTARYRGGPYCR